MLATAGCSNGSGPSSLPAVSSIPLHNSNSNSSSLSNSSSTSSSNSTPTSKPTSSSPKPTQSQPPQASGCSTGQLSLAIGQEQGAAGSFYVPLVVTNTSSGSCTLFGFPGVSFVTGSGKQVGADAARRHTTPHLVTLPGNGGKASALLRQPDPSAFPPSQCNAAKAQRLRLYPPGQFSALTVTYKTQVCTTNAQARATIGPMQAGDNPSQ